MADVTNALAFERVGEPPGIEVVDRIEQQRYTLYTPDPVSIRQSPTEDFRFPVGRAIEFETSELTLSTVVLCFLRDSEGDVVAEVDHQETISLPEDQYCLELSPQIKTYVEFEAPVEVESGPSTMTVRFSEPTVVRLGVRSRHERPAGVVSTTTDPIDIMAAIETFGSALKTKDPERAYPTLRGHPPAIELGDDLSIPDGLESPDTGITLELPCTFEKLYVAAPLAYYLGASIEPGTTPQIVTQSGFTHSLSGPEGYETLVANALKQIFFLDCVTRTEGLYQIPLEERRRIEPLLDIDFADLYGRSLEEQVAAYLETPYSVVEDHLPEWPLSTHVAPVAETVEQLPFVVDDLAVIKTARPNPSSKGIPSVNSESKFARDDVLTRSAGHQEVNTEDTYVQPDATDAIEQAWIGDDIPIGASKLTTEAFRNRLDREITVGDIEIAIVVNDDRMDAERDIVDQVYGDREDLPFEITVHENTTVDELGDILGLQRGFFHYIGHTERDGFVCSDGKLDAGTIEEVGIESFLLNACSSYNQGLNLIEAGAIGGIVTLTEIINEEAVAIGESVARLLNSGFPLRASLTIARDESIQGGQYIVVGDGGMSVTQAEGRVPNLLKIDREGSEFKVGIQTYTTKNAALGTVYMPYLDAVDSYYLGSGDIDTFRVSRDELTKFLRMEDLPVRLNDEIRWSSSLTVDEIP